LDSTGKFITPFEYSDVQGFTIGMAPAKKNGSWGFVDTLGKAVVPFQYSNARQFSEGLAAVANKGKELWGFINRHGDAIIAFDYDFADSFNEEGEARVIKRGKMIWIDKNNQKVHE